VNLSPRRLRNDTVALHTAVQLTPKSLIAVVLALTCMFSLGIDVPALAAAANPASSTKKTKADPALKGLPVTELSADEAVLHALNRLA